VSRGQTSITVKIITVASVALLLAATGAAAFVAGYSLAFSKVADVYAETSVLKAKAAELEEQILHLRNYAVLIDAIAVNGKAVKELQNLPIFPPQAGEESTPADMGKTASQSKTPAE